ncbi:MAG: toll/interleukin-1 receptor domain-containing protein [Planctomycetes bacterium]|nr:toll/interleukin-1 receptor domain-containing protein [Planctomycetota bacterium]
MLTWDAFISHASEDKAEVALPLAAALTRAGLRVWLDKQQLEIGDSLRQKIDAGLAQSRFGVVVLSEQFFQKRWTQKELDGLVAKEDLGVKVLLPVWHRIDQRRVAEFSPTLAGVLAARTADGIDTVAAQIARVVLNPANRSISADEPSITRRLVDILESEPKPDRIGDFLKHHSAIVLNLFGNSQGAQFKVAGPLQFGSVAVHMGVSQLMLSTKRWRGHLVQFGPTDDAIITSGGELTAAVNGAIAGLQDARKWVAANLPEARELLAGISPTSLGIVFAGRRPALSGSAAQRLGDINDQSVGVSVRTYDHLIESALAVEIPRSNP